MATGYDLVRTGFADELNSGHTLLCVHFVTAPLGASVLSDLLQVILMESGLDDPGKNIMKRCDELFRLGCLKRHVVRSKGILYTSVKGHLPKRDDTGSDPVFTFPNGETLILPKKSIDSGLQSLENPRSVVSPPWSNIAYLLPGDCTPDEIDTLMFGT